MDAQVPHIKMAQYSQVRTHRCGGPVYLHFKVGLERQQPFTARNELPACDLKPGSVVRGHPSLEAEFTQMVSMQWSQTMQGRLP